MLLLDLDHLAVNKNWRYLNWKKLKVLKVKKIAIVWESETGGGVNSYLRYLLQSKSFLDKEIVIYTNYQNSGAKSLINDFKEKKK